MRPDHRRTRRWSNVRATPCGAGCDRLRVATGCGLQFAGCGLQFFQANHRWKALGEIFTMHSNPKSSNGYPAPQPPVNQQNLRYNRRRGPRFGARGKEGRRSCRPRFAPALPVPEFCGSEVQVHSLQFRHNHIMVVVVHIAS